MCPNRHPRSEPPLGGNQKQPMYREQSASSDALEHKQIVSAEQIRNAWHRFILKLGVTRREGVCPLCSAVPSNKYFSPHIFTRFQDISMQSFSCRTGTGAGKATTWAAAPARRRDGRKSAGGS